MSYYYYFFTHTFIGKMVFRHMLERPERYLKIVDWLKEKKRIDASRHRFAMQYLQTEHSRKFLLLVWPAMSALMPNYTKLRAAIRQYRIPVAIFMGAYDKIIPVSLAHRFKSGLDSVTVHVLQKGHRVFDNENTGDIAKHLL
jgi:pimeloyl-ACP methyl ester carboxylesterase